MEKKIDIAAILKDCPSGMELNCTMFERVEFDGIVDNEQLPIRCRIKNPDGGYNVYNFTKHGNWIDTAFAKCVIFPKDRTTWEGFVLPCKFKDGDIISDCLFDTICIFKGEGRIKGTVDFYCGISGTDELFIKDVKDQDEHFGEIYEYKFATEEEKEKLFQVIKDNGYKWDVKTKSLKKLIEPKFKVGDKIINDGYLVEVTDIFTDDETYGYKSKMGVIGGIFFTEQDEWELVPNKFDINTLKPFDKVLVRDNNTMEWDISFFSHCNGLEFYKYSCLNGSGYAQCIPYEENKHLLGKTNKCDEFYIFWEE